MKRVRGIMTCLNVTNSHMDSNSRDMKSGGFMEFSLHSVMGSPNFTITVTEEY